MFSNQTTNLSTLSTALASLCREFDAASSLDSKRSQSDNCNHETRGKEADEYLDSLVKRVDDVDEALMKSTEHLLPTLSGRGEASRMTATELSQVLSSLHAIHSQQIQRIETLLARSPEVDKSTNTTPGESVVAPNGGDTPHHWSLGLPLEKVVETDNETDRYSYGSASSIRSSMRTPFSQGPGTPCTPSLRDLRLSASTTSILTHEVDSPSIKKIEIGTAQFATTRSLREGSEEENSNLKINKNVATSAVPQTTLDEAISSSSAAGLEAIRKYHSGINHVDIGIQADDGSVSVTHSHLFYDDDSVDESTLCPTVVAEDRKQTIIGQGGDQTGNSNRKAPLSVANEQNAQYAAEARDGDFTGEERISHTHSLFTNGGRDEFQPNSHQPKKIEEGEFSIKESILSPEIDVARQNIFRNQHDISHVLVENEASPSQTLLTMDATMFLHDTDAISQSSRQVNDAASLGEETPVLDRYRIISDDNSVGFKVLPNERGSQRKSIHAKRLALHDESRVENVPKTVRFLGRSEDENENGHLRHRKTPYPVAVGDNPSVLSESPTVAPKSKLNNLTSPYRFEPILLTDDREFNKENRTVVRASPNNDIGQPVKRNFGNSVSFNLHQELPKTPARSSKSSFRKTPYRANSARIEDDPADKCSRQVTTVRFDARSPLNGSKEPYRKTPHPKITERSSIESLKFHQETRFECETPVRGDRKIFRRTPYVMNRGVVGHEQSSPRHAVHFEGVPDAPPSSTPRSKSVTFRKTPYRARVPVLDRSEDDIIDPHNLMRSPLVEIRPAKPVSGTPKSILLAHDDTLASPVSLSSDITGLTGVSYSENQRELFPAIESLGDRKAESRSEGAAVKTPRKSASSLIAKISGDEFEEASPLVKSQFSLEETNRAISALNGAAFLRAESSGSIVQFTDTEAYKILRNVGFKRRRCKGLLMSLCHWRRLAMHQEEETETDFGVASSYFEIIQ